MKKALKKSLLMTVFFVAAVALATVVMMAVKSGLEKPIVEMSWTSQKCVKVIDAQGEHVCPADLNSINGYTVEWVR